MFEAVWKTAAIGCIYCTFVANTTGQGLATQNVPRVILWCIYSVNIL